MKVTEIPYKRYPIETLKANVERIAAAFDGAKSAEEQRDCFLAFEKEQKHFQTSATMAMIRFSLNTQDPFYSDENDYYDEQSPVAESIYTAFYKKLLTSPFRTKLETYLSPLLFKELEIQQKAFDDKIVGLMQEENKLTTKYDRLLSTVSFDWDGQKLNQPLLGKYKTSPDRKTREKAYNLHGRWLKEHGDELDTIYDDLVRVRTEMARKMGYDNYVTLGYYRMGRNCYDKNDVAVFRSQILKDVVPVIAEIKKEQAASLGADKLYIYDLDIALPQGSPSLEKDVDTVFEAGRKMYKGLSGETSAFFQSMCENDAFDVISRAGKTPGGYCTDIPDYAQQFIFANFNGTVGDVDVLTHEFGHAFAGHQSRFIPVYALQQPGMETCEIHSMSMEFFCYPFMDLFFDDKAGDYRYTHLSSALSFLPYGTMVDHFQHLCYEKPEMTKKERNDLWLSLEEQYRPYYRNEGVTGFEDGRRWQFQAHIFDNPFYYIDYCLAQFAACQFLMLSQKDKDESFRRYNYLLTQGGTATYRELLGRLFFRDPFEEDSVGPVIRECAGILNTLKP